MMNNKINDVFEMLEDDIVSHGLLAQCVESVDGDAVSMEKRVSDLLKELLESGRVEIGVTTLLSPKYVQFVAWNGSVDERITRAAAAVRDASEQNKEFAYWLCLKDNVDCFESNQEI